MASNLCSVLFIILLAFSTIYASRGSDARGNTAKSSRGSSASNTGMRGSRGTITVKDDHVDMTVPDRSSSSSSNSFRTAESNSKTPEECSSGKSPEERPNILFILMDDLGWGDLSATTGQFPTPNMDSLYTNSLQINRHYIHLMCSPSRTQFMTGRYAMNLGFGEFFPWDDAEIGGIPLGQPTVANWLSQYGEYTTYGVGKWQMGYANERLTPLYNGFNHFYGFYQGAIDYVTKTYNDIEDGDIGVYDFFEDGEACYDVIESDENSMNLYGNKILEYLAIEGGKARTAQAMGESVSPFYMYAALQSMHVPFPVIPEFEEQCSKRTSQNTGSKQWINERTLYCELIFLTDRIVGNIVDALKLQGLWDNTLIVFTADNGGETTRGASNYPLRGTKGEPYEGNTRVITALSGGVIESQNLYGQVREDIVSNLDWTPTILDFAGYLECIDEVDYTWDGMSQYNMIMGTQSPEDRRTSLVINIGDDELRSARIMIEHEGTYYKYIRSDSTSAIDRWSYSPMFTDSWSAWADDGVSLVRDLYDDADLESEYRWSQAVDDCLLFDVSNDESERYNLLDSDIPHFDADLNAVLIEKSNALLREWVDEHVNDLFAAPIAFLHERLAIGDPKLVEDGRFVRPFLSNSQYLHMIKNMFANEANKGNDLPRPLQDLYTNE